MLKDKGDTLIGYSVTLARSSELKSALTKADREQVVSQFIASYKALSTVNAMVHTVEAADSKGVMVARGHNPEKFGDDKSKAGLFAKALSSGAPQIGMEVSPSTGLLSIDAVQPVLDGSLVIGLVKVGTYPKDNTLVELKKALNVDIAVYDTTGGKLIGTSLKGLDEKLTAVVDGFTQVETSEGKFYAKKYPLMYQGYPVPGASLVLLTDSSRLKISEVIANISTVINDIAKAVEEQSAATTEIANNISQASSGITEVNENVAQSTAVIADITRDIAQINQQSIQVGDGSNQVEQSAKSLSELADQLQNLVSKFKV